MYPACIGVFYVNEIKLCQDTSDLLSQKTTFSPIVECI